MKGLLLKDLYTLSKQTKVYLLFIIMFSVLPMYNANCFALIYAAMLPMTALAYDERSKWNTLAKMMPYSETSIVLSKYILGFFSIGLALAVTTSAKLITPLFSEERFEPTDVMVIAVVASLAVIMLDVTLPLFFRFGVEKGRVIYIAVMAVMAIMVVGFAAGAFTFAMNSSAEYDLNIPIILLALLLVTAAVSALSVRVSVAICRKNTD